MCNWRDLSPCISPVSSPAPGHSFRGKAQTRLTNINRKQKRTQHMSNNSGQELAGRKVPMASVVKKHSISSELAQKMVDEAVAKAGQLGVAENVAILDDGGNLKAFRRMDG